MTNKIFGMIGLAVRAGKVKFGVFMTQQAIDLGKARLVIVPEDLGQSNLRSLKAKCHNTDTPIITVGTKESLGKAVGKKDTVALCVCDDNFTSAILKLYGGGING